MLVPRKDQPPRNSCLHQTQAMLPFRHLTVALVAASVFGALPANADSGVLMAGQTLSQVCMGCKVHQCWWCKRASQLSAPASLGVWYSKAPSHNQMQRSHRCRVHTQGTPLPSADGASVLILGSDGNLVLYNTLAQQLYGNFYASTIFASGTAGKGRAPYHLTMQGVRSPSLLALLPWHSAYPSLPLAWLLCG